MNLLFMEFIPDFQATTPEPVRSQMTCFSLLQALQMHLGLVASNRSVLLRDQDHVKDVAVLCRFHISSHI